MFRNGDHEWYEQLGRHRSSPEGHPIHRISLPPNPSSVRQAHRFAADLVADADVRDVVVLLVSELVTNAVLHGAPHSPEATVGMAIALDADRVLVEIDDAGANIPSSVNGTARPADRARTHPRGESGHPLGLRNLCTW